MMSIIRTGKIITLITIIILLLINGCKAKSVSEESQSAENAVKPGTNGFVYTNTKYGFSLDFPASWKDLVYREALVDYGDGINAPVVYFGLPDQADIFAVGIYTGDQWDKMTKLEGLDGKAGLTPMARNSLYLFDYSVGHYAANEEMLERRFEINDIIITFRVMDINS